MIKIFLRYGYSNQGYAEWEKGNKRYKCIREFNVGKRIYALFVADVPNNLRLDNLIRSESLSDINEWLAKSEVEIVDPLKERERKC